MAIKYEEGPQARKTDSSKEKAAGGTYFQSKYKNTKYGTIEPKTNRFPDIKASPGPGDYNLGDMDQVSQAYLISEFRSRGTRPFPK